jgi:cell division protein FtsZ
MPEVKHEIETFARIRVVGVGGAGTAAVNRMIEEGVSGVDFVVVNTDAQSLHHSKARQKLHIGRQVTRGLGAGADPKVGQTAADESREEIKQILGGADMLFITFGAGGGTGGGAAPIIAEIAQELGILTVGIATKPFAFEGEKRRRNAEAAIAQLRKHVDTLITIPNDRLLQTIDRRTPLLDAFKVADDVLRQGVQGISDLITIHGLINLDFADVKTVMTKAGSALMGIGRASGENRAVDAAQQAIKSPLLEVSIDGARGVLFNVTGGSDMTMHEINEVAEIITAAVDPEANIIFGATLHPDMGDELQVTVVAAGFDAYYADSAKEEDDTGLAYFSRPAPEAAAEPALAGEDMDETVGELEIDRQPPKADLRQEEPDKGSIWSIEDEEEDEEEWKRPAFLRRLKKRKKDKDPADDKDTSA